jgi:hypothetical protein
MESSGADCDGVAGTGECEGEGRVGLHAREFQPECRRAQGAGLEERVHRELHGHRQHPALV